MIVCFSREVRSRSPPVAGAALPAKLAGDGTPPAQLERDNPTAKTAIHFALGTATTWVARRPPAAYEDPSEKSVNATMRSSILTPRGAPHSLARASRMQRERAILRWHARK